jgi:hypothetical protein
VGAEPDWLEAAVEPIRGASLRTFDQWWARSPSALRRLSNPYEGPAFEPLISRRARGPSALRRLSNPSEGPAFEPLISRGARGPLPSRRRIPFGVSPFPIPVARERKRKRIRNRTTWRTSWGPSASEGPQKRDLTMFSKYASRYLRNQVAGIQKHGQDEV